MIEADPSAAPALAPRRAIQYILPIIAYLVLIPATLHGYVRNEQVKHVASILGGQFNTNLIILTFIIWALTVSKRYKKIPRMVWWALDIALGIVILMDSWKYCGLKRPNGSQFGFPSGHTGLMFAMSWMMEEMFPPLGPIWYALAVAIGWSRVEVSAHFPYQVLCAAPMGFAIAWAVTTLPEGIFLPRFIHLFESLRARLLANRPSG
jgi:membrane-associated phospholipid phosphatase